MKNVPYIRLVAGGIVLVVLFYKPVKRMVTTPFAVYESWVESLRTSPIGRFREMGVADGQTARGRYGDSVVEAIEQVNEQKRRLFTTYRNGHGKMGISNRYSTVEGDPIFTWLLVEDGSARFIKDSTRDAWGSAAGVATRPLKSMRLGFMREGKFVEGELSPTDSPVVVLALMFQKGGRELYY